MSAGRRPIAEALGVTGAFAVLACLATSPLVFQLATSLPNDLGDPLLNTWILAWDARRLAHFLRGVWDAPIFFPYANSLAYSEHLIGVALFTAPIQWTSGNPLLAYNVAFIGSFVLAGAGMYLLVRELTHRVDAAFLAGLIFAFTPYRFAQIAHLQMLMWGWLPVSLWALHRYFSTGAWRFLAVAAVAYVMLSLSNNYLMYFGALPLAFVGIHGVLVARRQSLYRVALQLFAAAALVLVALSPILIVYSRVRQDIGLVRRSDEILKFSAAVDDYTRAHVNVWIWRGAGGLTGEHELFPGAVALILAIVAIGAVWREKQHVRLYTAIASVAFILSLGPAPSAWRHRLPFAAPYAWLLAVVPGLDGMRSVGRLNAVVVTALSVLAGFGAARLIESIRSDRRSIAVGVVAVLVLVDGWAAPIQTKQLNASGDPADREMYAFLAAAPRGAVLELPLGLADPSRELTYQYMTLFHGQRLVNGRSGYETPLLALLHGDDAPFDDASQTTAAVDMLRSIGVRYVIVHLDAFDRADVCDRLVATLESDRAQVASTRRFDRSIVFSLVPAGTGSTGADRPAPSVALVRVPPSAIHARASRAADRLPLLFDGDPDSRWLTMGRQTGSEWIELELDRPRDVRRLRLQMARRSLHDYPRDLAVDVVENGESRTVFAGSVLTPFVHGLLADGNYPAIDLRLPPSAAGVVRLRQLAATRTFFWSIHELELWEGVTR